MSVIKYYIKFLKNISIEEHKLKTLRGLISICPFLGGWINEYIPSAPLSDEEQFKIQTITNEYYEQKCSKSWHSEDKQRWIIIDKDGNCEQSGNILFRNHLTYITFYHPFTNNNYFFTLEQNTLPFEIQEKTTTYIKIYTPRNSKKEIRWLVKGHC